MNQVTTRSVPPDVTQGSTRLTVATLVALTALLTAGCGDATEPAAQQETPATSTPTKPYTVEQLVATIGCTPQFVPGKTKDFRQASCTVAGDVVALLDFETADGQRAWLDAATVYGGVYLSGERWVLSGKSEEYMEELRSTLGGTIEKSGGFGATRQPSGS